MMTKTDPVELGKQVAETALKEEGVALFTHPNSKRYRQAMFRSSFRAGVAAARAGLDGDEAWAVHRAMADRLMVEAVRQ
jgi:hypothetical protein